MKVATKTAYFISSPTRGVYFGSDEYGTPNFRTDKPINEGAIFWHHNVVTERLKAIHLRVPDAFIKEDLLTV
jgi:hypothetical protein